MEGVNENIELNEWELLHNSSVDSNSLNSSNSFPNLMDLDSFEPERHALIQTDYFSVKKLEFSTESEQGSVESDNPSWVDPETESRFVGKGIWPDSGSDRGEDCNFDGYEGNRDVGFVGNRDSEVGFEGIGRKSELGFVGNEEFEVGLDGIGEKSSETDLGFVGNGKFEVGFVGNREFEVGFEGIGENSSKTDLGFVGNEKSLVGLKGIGEIGSKSEWGFVGKGKSFAGLKGIGSKSELSVVGNGNSFVGIEGRIGSSLEYSGIGQDSEVDERFEGENDGVVSETGSDGSMEVAKARGESEKKSVVVWWKVPLELLKFCAFRVSPVWTFSMAAAVMGVVILTRRLYKLKKKSQALKLKVTMDDKKVSQFMSRTARLNEAFSVVKRVPVISPALPAAGGLSQWPVMSLR